MSAHIALGLHVGPESVSSAYVAGEQVYQLDEVRLADHGRDVYWFRSASDQLEYFAARDLVGLSVGEADPAQTVRRSVEAVLAPLVKQGLTAERLVLALPAAYPEFHRRHLLARLAGGLPPVRLIDSTTAAFHALKAQSALEGIVALLVAEDSALEVALARVQNGRADIFAHESLAALSGRALNHHLLQLVLDRLPEEAGAALQADGEPELNRLLRRVAKNRAMLARIQELPLPVRPAGAEECTVKLRRADVIGFLKERFPLLADAVRALKLQAGAGAAIRRVLLLGDLGEFSEFTATLEQLLAPVETGPLTYLADGAALAAQEPFTAQAPPAAPPPGSLPQFLAEHARPLRLPARTAANPQEAFQHLKKYVAQLIAAEQLEAARHIVQPVKEWADRLLAALAGSGKVPTEPAAGEPHGRKAAGASPPAAKSRTARRFLEEADRLLAAGRVLDAVNASHQAFNAAPEDHEILMGMLDVHRRGAALLAGPEHFEAAVRQLRCALQHRQNDQVTRQALAARLVEHALHVEKLGQPAEAVGLLEEASVLADDETQGQIMEHLERLEGA